VSKTNEFGHYVLVCRQARDALGELWRAFSVPLNRVVSLKLVRHDPSTGGDGPLREAQTIARLRHPHFAAVHEVGTWDNWIYIAREEIDGISLTEWIASTQPTIGQSIQICAGLADALHAAHELGLVHGNLDPASILINRSGSSTAKIRDRDLLLWGMSRSKDLTGKQWNHPYRSGRVSSHPTFRSAPGGPFPRRNSDRRRHS
jgi:serine/threonine protein kinase